MSESVASGTSGSPTITAINNTIAEQSQEWLKNIGYIALCISILLFLIIKILKYLLARRAMALQQQKFKLNMSLSQLNTPISKSPLNRSFTP